MARVYVIVPCYNYGDLLEACVASVLSQQEVDARVLIMDDASTDSTPEVGRRLAAQDPRVEYRRHDVNRGHIATYNEALDDVTGDYCMILSADDLLTPGSLMRATRLIDANDGEQQSILGRRQRAVLVRGIPAGGAGLPIKTPLGQMSLEGLLKRWHQLPKLIYRETRQIRHLCREGLDVDKPQTSHGCGLLSSETQHTINRDKL